MIFGEKLKQLRKATKKSQSFVADDISKCGFDISQTYLSSLENAKLAPRQETLEVFSKYYNVPLTYFFDNDDVTETVSVRDYVEALRRFTPNSDNRFIPLNRRASRRLTDDLDYLDSD